MQSASNQINQIKQAIKDSVTPLTDAASEQWGARKVVDASVCAKLEQRNATLFAALTNARDIAAAMVDKIGLAVLGDKVDSYVQKAKQLQRVPTPISMYPQHVTQQPTSTFQSLGVANQTIGEHEFTTRVSAYMSKQLLKGKQPTVRQIQNSFSPQHPSRARVMDALKNLGFTVNDYGYAVNQKVAITH